jgi:hypothetical protein
MQLRLFPESGVTRQDRRKKGKLSKDLSSNKKTDDYRLKACCDNIEILIQGHRSAFIDTSSTEDHFKVNSPWVLRFSETKR